MKNPIGIMSYPKKLVLLGLPVTLVAVYLLQGWSMSNDIPSFNPVNPSKSVETAQPYRENPSSLYIPRRPTIDQYVTSDEARENLSQDGDHVFSERRTSTQAFANTTERTTHINDEHQRRASTPEFANTTERTTHINDEHQRRASTKSFANTTERNNDAQYSTTDQAVKFELAQSALCDKPPRDAGIDELLRRYRHCMGQLVSLALQDGNGKVSPTPLGKQTSYEELGMLSGDGWRRMAGRLASVKNGCRAPAIEFTKAPALDDVVFDRAHHLAYCRHGKAATSSLLNFMVWLNHVGPTPPHFVDLHNRIFNYLPRPTQESRNDVLKNSFVFTAVRHPFRRLVSAYCNKEVEGKFKILPYKIRMKTPEERELELLEYNYKVKSGTREPTVMAGPWIRRAVRDQSLPEEGQKDGSLLAHYLSAVDFNSTLQKNLIELTTDIQGVLSEGGRHQSTQKLASAEPFRMFVHGVVLELLNCTSDPSCLSLVDRHIKPQVIRWNPCVLNFDTVMKVETLDQDIVLLKDLFGLPDPLAEGEETTRKVEEIPGERMEEYLNAGQIQKKLRSRRAVTQSDDDKGLEKKASEETKTYNEIDGFMIIENQLGNRSIVGDTDQVGNRSIVGDTDQVGNRSIVGDTDQVGNRSIVGDTVQLGNRSIVGDTNQTFDSVGLYELSENNVPKITPGSESDLNLGSSFFRRNKSGPKCGTYEEYMTQLSQRDIDLLYTSYYWDFRLFGYEPFD